jgi:hypothetical protein
MLQVAQHERAVGPARLSRFVRTEVAGRVERADPARRDKDSAKDASLTPVAVIL